MPSGKPYLIVGAGLAGTVLALTFYKRSVPFLLVDKVEENTSSKVAGGLYNPLVFKRLTKSWMADKLIPAMEDLYSWAEELTEQKFLFKKHIYKILSSEQEVELWKHKKNDGEIFEFITGHLESGTPKDWNVKKALAMGEVLHSGYLDIHPFLSACKELFKQRHSYLSSEVNYNDLQLGEDVKWNGNSYKGVVFCEGYQASLNPYFNTIGWNLCKGEVLTINCNLGITDRIINKTGFILPLPNGNYRAGSNYQWDYTNDLPSGVGLGEVSAKIRELTDLPFTVLDHKAGIRPTIKDRRPVLGTSTENRLVHIFNGLGTKGVMLAPYWAQVLVGYLTEGDSIPAEVSVTRFN